MKLTFQKIGDMLGISRQRAHQLYRKGRITIEVRDGKHFVVWQKEQITRKRSVYSVDDMVQNEKVR